MNTLIQNLKEAIIGETKAQLKYELFSEKARKDDLPAIADLFQAISFAESIHIKNHKRALTVLTDSEIYPNDFIDINEEEIKNQVKSTQKNLETAIKGENYEAKTMYKEFEKNADKAGKITVRLSFSLAREAETIHAKLYKKYLKKLKKGKKVKERDIYVCQICGNVEFDKAPDICPVCDHDKQFFKKFA